MDFNAGSIMINEPFQNYIERDEFDNEFSKRKSYIYVISKVFDGTRYYKVGMSTKSDIGRMGDANTYLIPGKENKAYQVHYLFFYDESDWGIGLRGEPGVSKMRTIKNKTTRTGTASRAAARPAAGTSRSPRLKLKRAHHTRARTRQHHHQRTARAARPRPMLAGTRLNPRAPRPRSPCR